MRSLFSLRSCLILLLVNTAGFQLFVLSHQRWLYPVLKIGFFLLLLIALGTVLAAVSRKKILLWALLGLFALRLPFYLNPNGLIATSDNAVEALQSVDIQKQHVAPFFRHENIRHQGTLKYLWTAFLWDVFGRHYLWALLLQLAFFVGFLAAFLSLLRGLLPAPALLFAGCLQYAFIENVFDHSLLVRGGPYQEMLFFFFVGAALIDPEWRDRTRIIAGAYFMAFAIYLHPLAMIPFLAFAGSVLLLSRMPRRTVVKNTLLLSAGFGLGILNWAYYLAFFKAKPPIVSAETWALLPPSQWSLHLVPSFLRDFWEAFRNIFNSETLYLAEFFGGRGLEGALAKLSYGLVYLSGAVFILGCILVAARFFSRLKRRERLSAAEWPYGFFLLLLGAVIAKIAFLRPVPTEPRHNFDLTILIMMAYAFVFGRIFTGKSRRTLIAAALAACLAFLSYPQVSLYARIAHNKERTYAALIRALDRYGVRYLSTDFIPAYTIHFLSHERILVSDALGPYSQQIAYPEIARAVDSQPLGKKAYLFYSQDYFRRPWHIRATAALLAQLCQNLDKAGVSYRRIDLHDYVLILPREARHRIRPDPAREGNRANRNTPG